MDGDEVIADSEDEDNSFTVHEISSFTDRASAPLTSIFPVASSSLSVTGPSDPISLSSNSGPLPRPKPRPAYKKKDKPETISSSSSILSPRVRAAAVLNSSEFHMDMPSSIASIADRAKMRSRNTKSNVANTIQAVGRRSNISVSSDHVIELSTDEDELVLLPPSKSKSKSKGRADTKQSAKVSSDSPLTSTPEYVPKSRSIANKRNKTSHLMSPHVRSTSQGTVPTPTPPSNDPMIPIPFNLLSSKLPPSDPPTSTPTMCGIPPIETLPNLDTDPLTSPSSLFDAPMSAQGKRKRVMLNIDELDSDDHQISGIEMDVDAQMMPPPSVPLTLLPRPLPPSIDANLHATQSSSTEIVDLLPVVPLPASANVNSIKHAKKPKIAKTRKKNNKGHIAENGESDKDKPKGKRREQKRKKVEVVIQMPKNKGKGKEKEVFKSREFVEDDDEGEDLVVEASSKTIRTSDKPSSMTSLSSVPDSDEEDMLAGPSKKRKSTSGGNIQSAKARNNKDRVALTPKVHQAKVPPKNKDESPITTSSLVGTSPDKPLNTTSVDKGRRGKSKGSPSTIPDPQGNSEDQTKSRDVDVAGPQVALKANIKTVTSSETSTKPTKSNESLFPSLSSQYTIAPKAKSIPMSDLIRRVNSLPGSPFPSPQLRASRLSTIGTAYSPYLKSSRSMLSRIAPLHPNRRTPPPPLPPPPPPKKTKKEKEREEAWEEELIESVGGITEWACMTDTERKELRKLKRQRDMAGWEE